MEEGFTNKEILNHIIDLKSDVREVKTNVENLVTGAADREQRIRKLEGTSKTRGGAIAAIIFVSGGVVTWLGTLLNKLG